MRLRPDVWRYAKHVPSHLVAHVESHARTGDPVEVQRELWDGAGTMRAADVWVGRDDRAVLIRLPRAAFLDVPDSSGGDSATTPP